MVKGYCRYCGSKCLSLKLSEAGKVSCCRKKGKKVIKTTTPIGGNIKCPPWCPKLH